MTNPMAAFPPRRMGWLDSKKCRIVANNCRIAPNKCRIGGGGCALAMSVRHGTL
jgi:hypothetical protein